MNQDPFNNSNSGFTENLNNGKHLEQVTHSDPEVELPPKSVEDVRAVNRSLKRLYLILLTVGIALGAVISVGVVTLLNRFELTAPPTQVDDTVE
ncbi:hypothetical protein IQ268_15385 [Oculatella sp. LEGE 06141]|uniref:hypothetical protein n=1 Tax=Oculatella sp. LEGE 06141 TaxID=1828648 RepID=UPI00187FF1AD|nr:hypothetical protein [Oculatella sp. LEGE 06141]MBE9179954.1 hypothetical protein [Oculatella sp. LEGE 06141]